ncbi:MAG: TonB family protein [Planctomycetes bacterium]|nr:TonB family protein [Planctomycetota bacterium]
MNRLCVALCLMISWPVSCTLMRESALEKTPAAPVAAGAVAAAPEMTPGSGDAPVYTLDEIDTKPSVIDQPAVALNDHLRRKTPGTVRLAFVVDQNGVVIDPYVISSTDSIFERPALESLKQWRFAPGIRDGLAVQVRMTVPISFGAVPVTAGGKVKRAAPSWVSPLDAAELAIWNDPGFKKAFVESYIAETEIEPRVTMAEREQMEKVLELISANNMGEAVSLLESHRGDASSAVFDFTLANIHFQQERLSEAAEFYRAAVTKYPKFRRAWRNLGLVHVRQNEFDRALPALTKVIELGGGDAVTYGLLGFAYSSVEVNLPAESAYRMAMLLDPGTLDWKMGLARSLFKQERYADAAALCGDLISDHPDRSDLWLLQANAYIGLNQPLKAAENYEFVDRLGESTTDSLNMLGDIYVNEELFSLAVDTYIRAMEADPQRNVERPLRAAKVLTARGALQETGKLVDRIESLRAGRLDPEDHKDLLRLRARMAVAEGAGEEEVRVLEELVDFDPLDGEALILLGQHAGKSGDPEKAVFYFERAANLEAFEADAKVRHAQLLVGQGRYQEALPLLRRAQTLKPRDHVQEYIDQVERVAQSR